MRKYVKSMSSKLRKFNLMLLLNLKFIFKVSSYSRSFLLHSKWKIFCYSSWDAKDWFDSRKFFLLFFFAFFAFLLVYKIINLARRWALCLAEHIYNSYRNINIYQSFTSIHSTIGSGSNDEDGMGNENLSASFISIKEKKKIQGGGNSQFLQTFPWLIFSKILDFLFFVFFKSIYYENYYVSILFKFCCIFLRQELCVRKRGENFDEKCFPQGNSIFKG